MTYNKVKGTYDILPSEASKWHFLEETVKKLFKQYHYFEIRTPIIEHSNVFFREDEFSDMVIKETYNFKDRGNRDLTLRPEGTAGVVRSYVENKLYVNNKTEKLFYIGPFFRYERPQKGRFRQFYQLGVEAIGSKSPYLDAEVISLAYNLVNQLKLKNVKVYINSIGDIESRNNYLEALVNYLIPFKEQLSFDSKERLNKNPLRILDSKDLKDQEIVTNAPKPIDYLSPDSKKYYDEVVMALKNYNVSFFQKDTLVRGLDYYSETVFEIEADIKGFGSHNVLGGGGRYENLVKSFNGPNLSGIGFAFGMERLINIMEIEDVFPKDNNDLDIAILNLDNNSYDYSIKIANLLRENNYNVLLNDEVKSFKSLLKSSLNENPKYLIFIGLDEKENNLISIKNTKTERQEKINFNDLINFLNK